MCPVKSFMCSLSFPTSLCFRTAVSFTKHMVLTCMEALSWEGMGPCYHLFWQSLPHIFKIREGNDSKQLTWWSAYLESISKHRLGGHLFLVFAHQQESKDMPTMEDETRSPETYCSPKSNWPITDRAKTKSDRAKTATRRPVVWGGFLCPWAPPGCVSGSCHQSCLLQKTAARTREQIQNHH